MTPVKQLFDALWDTNKDKLTWHEILRDALEDEAALYRSEYNEGYKDGYIDGYRDSKL